MLLVKTGLEHAHNQCVNIYIIQFFQIPGNPGDSGFLGYPKIIPSCIPGTVLNYKKVRIQ